MITRHHARIAALAGALLLAGCAGAPATMTRSTAPEFSEAAYRAHVERLSSDEFEGRAPRTASEQKTIDYIEQQFRAAGLAPGFGDSYRQAVPLVEIVTRRRDRP